MFTFIKSGCLLDVKRTYKIGIKRQQNKKSVLAFKVKQKKNWYESFDDIADQFILGTFNI